MPDNSFSQPHIFRALIYLQTRSAWNRLGARLRRLRQAKYLVGALAGAFYVYFFFLRSLFSNARGGLGGPQPTLPEEFAPLGESVAALFLLIAVLLAWVVPRKRAALAFSEAEVAFLFPAPVTRRTLINFKLLKSQFSILFTSLVFAVLSTRFGRFGQVWLHAAGWWLVLATLNLQFLGASFAITRLMDKGITPERRRWGIFLGLATALTAILVWAHGAILEPVTQDFSSAAALARYLRQFFEAGPLPYLLYPFRLLVRPYLAQDLSQFLVVLMPALGLLALSYVWVIRSDVAFEEASLDLSRRHAEVMTAAREGRDWTVMHGLKKGRRAPFRLAPIGSPAVALLWKNLIASGRLFNVRSLLVLGFSAALFALVASGGGNVARGGWSVALGMVTVMAFVWTIFVGPQLFRQDLRHDLPVADVLKQFPLRGWQVVLGEMLAPTVILTVMQWGLLALAACFFKTLPGNPEGLPVSNRLVVAFGAGLLVPVVNLLQMLIPNAAVLLWPGWMLSERGGHGGIEVMGQRLILLFGQVVVFLLAATPAAGLFAVVFLLLQFMAGWQFALLAASLLAAALLMVEAVLGILLLGRWFERFDVAAESREG